MNNQNYIHDKQDKNDLIKKYYFALIPLIMFSIYKNGFLLVQNDLISFSKIMLPIYFYLISIVIGCLISKIYKEKSIENILVCLILGCSISINTNIIFYPILLFILLFIMKYLNTKSKLSINTTCLIRLGLLLALFLNSYSYLNIGEKLNKFNYNLFDIFIGHGPGGLATTSLFLVIISFLILATSKYYKKIIALSASLSFIFTNLVLMFLTKDYTNLNIILNGSIYFSFVFLAADLYQTPYHKKGMLIYGIIIGILSSLLISLNVYYEAGYLSILLVSFFIQLFNKIKP